MFFSLCEIVLFVQLTSMLKKNAVLPSSLVDVPMHTA